MNRDPDERPHPDGAAPDEFDAIVALWRDEGDVPQWPDDNTAGDNTAGDNTAGDNTAGDDAAADEGKATTPTDVEDPTPPAPPMPPRSYSPPPLPEDEHFIPPEPPPLPRLGPPALVGLALIAVGIVLVVAPGWLGIPSPYGLPLGLVGLASGLGWLVLRLWPDPPDHSGDDDGDDGAVV